MTAIATADKSEAGHLQIYANGQAPLQQVRIDEILRSPFNRDRSHERKTEEWKEFVGSIRTHGIVQPLLGRPLPSALDPARKPGTPRIELVIGEGRWLGAAEAGLETVPLIVRQLTDREAIELQTIENDKRKDLSPIQQAEKYQQLLAQYEKDGLNKEQAMAELCKRIEKGKSTVYEALSLLALPAPVKEVVAAGRLPSSHAALLAKLGDAPELQAELTEIIAPANPDAAKLDALEQRFRLWNADRNETGLLSFRDVKRLVDEEVKNTAQRKAWQKAVAEHQAKGGEVMSAEDMQKAVTSYGSVMGAFVAHGECTYDYSKSGSKTYKELMGKHAPGIILAHDRSYKVIACYRKKDAIAAIEKNGHKKVTQNKPSAGRSGPTAQERQERAKRMEAVADVAIETILKSARAGKPKFPWEVFIGWLVMVAGCGYGESPILKRRKWKKIGSGFDAGERTIAHHAAKLSEKEMPALLLEVMLSDENDGGPWLDYAGKWDEKFTRLCRHYGVDLQKLTKQLAPPPPPAADKVQTPGKVKKRKPMSAAARAKISAALKQTKKGARK